MKLKKKAILYIEGMLDEKTEKEFKKIIKDRPDIQNFIKNYRWVESGLKLYFSTNALPGSIISDEEFDELARQDINKYLKNYKHKDTDRENNFLNKLNNITETEKKDLNEKYYFLLTIAASIAFIFIIFAAGIHFSKLSEKQKSAIDLFTENFQPAHDTFLHKIHSPFVDVNDGKLILKSANNFSPYNELRTVLRSENVKMDDLLLISVALIEMKEYDLARRYLNDLLNNTEIPLINAVRWYLALLNLKEGKNNNAIQNLQILCNSNNFYARESCILLEVLSKKNID